MKPSKALPTSFLLLLPLASAFQFQRGWPPPPPHELSQPQPPPIEPLPWKPPKPDPMELQVILRFFKILRCLLRFLFYICLPQTYNRGTSLLIRGTFLGTPRRTLCLFYVSEHFAVQKSRECYRTQFFPLADRRLLRGNMVTRRFNTLEDLKNIRPVEEVKTKVATCQLEENCGTFF